MRLNKKQLASVSVIIPNWNGLKLLKRCLPAIKTQLYKRFEVLIVDNGSTDRSVEFIQKSFPEFKVMKLPQNAGFAGAVNSGIKNTSGDYIMLLNNDTEIDMNCLKYLVRAAEKHPEVGMVAAKVKNFYKRNMIDNTGDYIDVVGHLHTDGFGEMDSPKFNQSKYIFAASGGGSLFKRDVFEKIGYFDEDYFLYMEDVDFGFRAQLAGIKAWYEPRALIYHKRMATSSKNMSLVEPICFRNMTMNIIKDFPKALLLHNNNWLKILLVHINTIIYLSRKGYIQGTLKAEWDLITQLGKLLKKRKKIQNLKVVSDDYIIQNVLPKKITFYGLLKKSV